MAAAIEWVKDFPVSELVERECLPQSESDAARIARLLEFYRVASVDAWAAQYGDTDVDFRHSPSVDSDEKVIITWLRL